MVFAYCVGLAAPAAEVADGLLPAVVVPAVEAEGVWDEEQADRKAAAMPNVYKCFFIEVVCLSVIRP